MAAEKIGHYDEQIIKLSDLELDCQNPRIGEQSDQSSAINTMLHRESAKIDEMADSIAKNGFLALELPCVYLNKKTNKYIIAEGNRRITALKVLHTPDLANGAKKYAKFKKLSHAVKGELPDEIKCAVFKSEKACLPYVLMRHGLGGDGASLKSWDALEKRRVKARLDDESVPALQVIDFVEAHGNLKPKHEQLLSDINITNLERLTDSAIVKQKLGIKNDNCIKSTHGDDWLVAVWQKIIEVVLDGMHQGEPFKVATIYNAIAQEKFIDEILYQVHKIPLPKPPAANPGAPAKPTPGITPNGKKSVPKPAPSRGGSPAPQPTTKRDGLVAKNFSPKGLAAQKLINIIDELKKLPVAKYPNSSAVLFRVFFELSVGHYMKTHRIKKVDAAGNELSEKEKRKAALKHLKAQPGADVRTFKALADTLNDSHPVSAQTLNFYVHSTTHNPNPVTLKTEWDNLQHIFDILWEK